MASAVSNLAALRSGSSASTGNERFNTEAASWDSRPFVHAASREAAKVIVARLEKSPQAVKPSDITNLELGCGTGILSFLLAPQLGHIVAIDAAEGMIGVLSSKLIQSGAPQNITPLALLLEDPEDPSLPSGQDGKRLKFDLITSHLVLHHIPDLEDVLKTMLGCLKPGGRVMLTDFEDFGPEARRFHPESKLEGVARHGIQRTEMEELMKRVGFVKVEVSVAWTMGKMVAKKDKDGDGEEEMNFPFVLCYGERSGE